MILNKLVILAVKKAMLSLSQTHLIYIISTAPLLSSLGSRVPEHIAVTWLFGQDYFSAAIPVLFSNQATLCLLFMTIYSAACIECCVHRTYLRLSYLRHAGGQFVSREYWAFFILFCFWSMAFVVCRFPPAAQAWVRNWLEG